MIDTDKYEGHTPVRKEWPRWCEDWLFSVYSDDGSHIPNWNQDNNLACDAPLLLAEVKRLRKQLEDCKRQIQFTADWIRDRGEDTHAKELDEFLGWME
tara:strand:- start:194 stop:487 length:294 start_codon:yes stop_codon:yes gene_type:complete